MNGQTTERWQGDADRLQSVPPGAAAGIALYALRFYKTYLSLLFAGNCRFEPTCSRYAYEAIERFGIVRGVWLGLKRLVRCQPLSRRFGYDPVPDDWHESAADERRPAVITREVHS